MFVNKSRLPHVLPPNLYWDNKQFDLEIDKVFQPAWHLVGLVNELSSDGDFVTRDLLGTPLLIRNFGGKHSTFLNVCPHRHSLLTHLPSGNSPTLRCQYHGWEFNESGKTGRIPDAKNFRPFEDGPECLRKFPTRTVGPLLFSRLAHDQTEPSDPPAPVQTIAGEFTADRWHLAEQWSYSFAANWKVVVENTVETYHAESLHPNTLVFGAGPDDVEHEIHPWGTALRANLARSTYDDQVAKLFLRRLQPGGGSHQYRLAHVFPNLFLIRIDAMLQVMTVLPSSPTTCKMTVAVLILRAEQESWINRLLVRIWGQVKCRAIKQVLAEDAALYPDIQRGLEASPFRGTISAREELVHEFGVYVAKQCGNTGTGSPRAGCVGFPEESDKTSTAESAHD